MKNSKRVPVVTFVLILICNFTIGIVNEMTLRRGNFNKEPKKILAHNVKSIFEQHARATEDYNIEVVVLNRTTEYCDMVLLKLTAKESSQMNKDTSVKSEKVTPSDQVMKEPEPKKIVFIVHALNTVGFYENEVLSTDQFVLALMSVYAKCLSKFDIYFIPLANPDGAAALSRDKRWSKNFSPQDDCPGVALDRNFDVAWKATVRNSCSPLYPGREPFSELETRAIYNVLKENEARIQAFFHVRSASDSADTKKGEAFLFPYGYTDVMGKEEEKFLKLMYSIEETIATANVSNMFKCDSMYNWYGGSVTGSSVDFAYKVMNVPYAFEVLLQSYGDTKVAAAALSVIWKRVFKVVFDAIIE